MKAESQTVVFVITGEFVTKQARTFWWDENEKDRALNLLLCLDRITTDQCLDVIFGRSRLTGDSKVGLLIKPDNAKTSPGRNRMEGTLVDTLRKDKEKARLMEDDLRDHLSEPRFTGSQYGRIEIGPRALQRVKSGEETIEDLASRGLVKHEPVLGSLRELKGKIRDLEADNETSLGLADAIEEVETPPKADPDLQSQNGWVDREGRFFPCFYSGHIHLADLLGFDERKLEKLGWMKISDYRSAPFPVPAREAVKYEAKISPTDAQKKVAVDWCTKFGHKIPKWVTE